MTLTKITKFVATRCHILRRNSTKFDFGWGSAPDPAGGAYSAPRPPSWWGGGHSTPRSRPCGPRFGFSLFTIRTLGVRVSASCSMIALIQYYTASWVG